MSETTIDIVRGSRCVLAVVHEKGRTRQYEYHRGANVDVVRSISLVKFKSGR